MELQELSTPSPGPGEVCILVSRAGLNFADILSRMGLYPGSPKPPFTPGMEVSGTVHEVGPDVEGFEIGDRVVGSGTSGVMLPIQSPKKRVSSRFQTRLLLMWLLLFQQSISLHI